MKVLPHVTVVGAGRTLGTTGIPAETGKTSRTTAIRAEIRSIGKIWTITAVSLIQMDTIQVVERTTLVVDGLTSTTVLQVEKGVGIIGIMNSVCPGEPITIISDLVGPETTRMISKKGNSQINIDLLCFMGMATDRA